MPDSLTMLAGSLDAAPRSDLLTLFDSLQLDVVDQPADSTLDVAATLDKLGSDTAQSAERVRAEDWSAPPAGAGPVLRRVVRLNRRLELP
ncbi:MAG: hypothetical protein M0Z63_06265 [Actinomycetota bacterium]|nr:hypothetical protein [Actinomycetota bacterium]